jgi:hypothetical protein
MFSVGLAERYGPIESIILSNICWWVETNRKNGKHFHDGRYWTYGSAAGFEKIFTYLKPEQIKYSLRNLREAGALLTGNYNRMKYDRTLWYTVSDEVMAIYECRKSGTEGLGGDKSAPVEADEDEAGSAEADEDEAGEEEFDFGDEAEAAGGGGTFKDAADTGDITDREGEAGEGPEGAGMGVHREWPNGHSHYGNFHNENGGKTIPIMENPTMDCGNFHDPLWKFPPPIPLINSYKKAAAAGGGSENDKIPPDVKEAAAAANFSPKAFNGAEALRACLTGRWPGLVLSADFYPRAVEWMGREALDAGYIDWLIEQCEKRKPDNLRGLFYRLFFASDLADLYRARGIPPPRGEAAEKAVCPACGTVHHAGLPECPQCGLARDRYGDADEVGRQKRINALTPEARRGYEEETRAAFFTAAAEKGDPATYRDQWIEIQKKYHLIS